MVINSIEKYKEKFILEVDLLNGVERLAIVEEINSILKDVKADDRAKLIAEKDMYKKRAEELEEKLHRIYSLDNDCDEEFEI